MSIEVEKKFILDNLKKQNLIRDAILIGTKTFTDIYYDNSNYDLTRKDIWLRSRDNRWELKIPMEHFKTRKADQYRELETEEEIIDYLKLPNNQNLKETLSKYGYKEFTKITTTRTKYKKNEFIIDLDIIDFGYEIAEIEKMVEKESEISQAIDDILKFAKQYNLIPGQVRGKVIEYLRRYSKEHLNALIEAGVVNPE